MSREEQRTRARVGACRALYLPRRWARQGCACSAGPERRGRGGGEEESRLTFALAARVHGVGAELAAVGAAGVDVGRAAEVLDLGRAVEAAVGVDGLGLLGLLGLLGRGGGDARGGEEEDGDESGGEGL